MPVTLVQAESFLAGRFGGGVRDVAPLGKGEWSRAFAFRRIGSEAAGDYVIRFGAYLEDFAKDRLAARYAGPDLPIPQIIEIGEAFGGYYAIAGRVFGGYIDEVDEAQMRSLLPSLFAALDAARLADLSDTTGYGGWGADGAAPFPSWRAVLLDVANDRPTDRIGGWRARLAASSVGAEPFDRAYEQLAALADSAADAAEERHLIHSDLLHFNVLVEGARVTGVLDWGCGLYGDFLYDLAWFCFWQPWYPAWRRIDFRAEALRHYASVGLAVPHFEARLRCCQIHIGLGSQAYQAYAGLWSDLRETADRTLAIMD